MKPRNALNFFLRSWIIRKLATWTVDSVTCGVRLLKYGNRLISKALRASGMNWGLVALRRLVNMQEDAGSRLEQRIAFELAVPAALLFKISNCIASFFQNNVSYLLGVEQSLLEVRQMLANIKKDSIDLGLLRDALDGLDEIECCLNRVKAKFYF